jgi:hypothetical protein
MLAGLEFKNITVPLYLFSPFQPGRFFVPGFIYEYQFKGEKNNKGLHLE